MENKNKYDKCDKCGRYKKIIFYNPSEGILKYEKLCKECVLQINNLLNKELPSKRPRLQPSNIKYLENFMQKEYSIYRIKKLEDLNIKMLKIMSKNKEFLGDLIYCIDIENPNVISLKYNTFGGCMSTKGWFIKNGKIISLWKEETIF